MKKIVLPVMLLTCIVAGILHNNYKKQEKIETILAEQTYLVPNVIIDPLFDPALY